MRKPCIKVPKINGEHTRCALIELELIDHSAKIASDAQYLYLPLIRIPLVLEFEKLPKGMEITDFEFRVHQKKPTLEGLLGFVPHYEVIGDIALIETDEMEAEKIAESLLKVHSHITTVLGAITPVTGEYRIREFRVIAGKEKTETIHREHGCRYVVDLAKAYFTPRLGTERSRILFQIKPGDVVVDMFAGVGPFSIQIAKKTKAKIYSFDLNPDAYDLLLENIRLNNLENQIIPYNIDVHELLDQSYELGRSLKHEADRIIMNLPESSLNFLDIACFLLKESGGIIHNYQFSEKPNPIKKAIENLEAKLEGTHYNIDNILDSKIVKNFSPKSDLVVVDLQINKI